MNEKAPMNDEHHKTECRTPAEGREGVTRIPTWKYDAVRRAILAVMRAADGEPLGFTELRTVAKDQMDEEALSRLGSWGWHFTTVKLNLEVQGEIKRAAGTGPQKLVLCR